MKIVVLACEGNSEVELMFQLLTDNHLIFKKEDVLDRRPIHLRQPYIIVPIVSTLPTETKITIFRIGDTQRDNFDISCFGETRINDIRVVKICTMPEIELLIIINEGLYEEYLKVKSKLSPKQFVKMNVTNYTSFKDYVNSHDLRSSIKEYKRIKKHKNGEGYLADLLKD